MGNQHEYLTLDGFKELAERHGDKVPFGALVGYFAQRNDDYDKAAIAQARESLHSDGSFEFDDATITSRGEDESGCYVLAWAWVDATDTMTASAASALEATT